MAALFGNLLAGSPPAALGVRDGRLTCAVHGATFKTDSGACVGGPCRSGLVSLPVEVVDGVVRWR